MNRYRTLKRRAVLATLAAGAAGSAGAQGWTEHRSEDGNFHVEMPGTPGLSTTPLAIGKDETAPLTEAVVRTPGAAYQAIYIAYPRRVATAASADVLLDTFRTNMTAGLTRRGDASLTLGRFVGRAFTILESDTRHIAVRLYWSRGKLYQLLVSGGPGIESRPDTRKFFDSFGLIKA